MFKDTINISCCCIIIAIMMDIHSGCISYCRFRLDPSGDERGIVSILLFISLEIVQMETNFLLNFDFPVSSVLLESWWKFDVGIQKLMTSTLIQL